MKELKKLQTKKHGQLFSIDAIIASTSFIIILLTAMYFWEYSREKIYLVEKRADLDLISKNALSVLVETSGEPANWAGFSDSSFNETNIQSLGLTKSSSINDLKFLKKGRSAGLLTSSYLVIDKNKIERLSVLPSDKIEVLKKILGLVGPGYKFQLMVTVWQDGVFVPTYTVGSSISPVSYDLVRVDRLAVMDGKYANVVLKLWQECRGGVC